MAGVNMSGGSIGGVYCGERYFSEGNMMNRRVLL